MTVAREISQKQWADVVSIIITVVLQRKGCGKLWMLAYKIYSIKGIGLMEAWQNKGVLSKECMD